MAVVAALVAFLSFTSAIQPRRQALQEHAEQCRTQADQEACQSMYADIRSANAADDMVDLAIWQFLAGLVGIALVGLTLQATRDAVKEANDATEVARYALRVSEEAGERQNQTQIAVQQGHVHVESRVTLIPDGITSTKLHLALNFINRGLTQITIETVVTKLRIDTALPEAPNPLVDPAARLGWQVSPGSNGLLNLPVQIVPNEHAFFLKGLIEGEIGIWVYGEVVFSDAVGGRRRQRFCHTVIFHADQPNNSAGWMPVGDYRYWGEEKIEA